MQKAFIEKVGKKPGDVGGRVALKAALDAMNPLMVPPGTVPAPPRPKDRARGPPAFPSQKRLSRKATKKVRDELEAEAQRQEEAARSEGAEKKAEAVL